MSEVKISEAPETHTVSLCWPGAAWCWPDSHIKLFLAHLTFKKINDKCQVANKKRLSTERSFCEHLTHRQNSEGRGKESKVVNALSAAAGGQRKYAAHAVKRSDDICLEVPRQRSA